MDLIMKQITLLLTLLSTVFFIPAYGQVTEPRVLHFNIADVPAASPFEGISSKRIYTDTVWIPIITIDKGAASGHHSHPDEQTMIILSGLVKAYVGDDEYILNKEDMLIVPSYIPHHFEALEDSRWIEVHGPGFTKQEFDPDSWN